MKNMIKCLITWIKSNNSRWEKMSNSYKNNNRCRRSKVNKSNNKDNK